MDIRDKIKTTITHATASMSAYNKKLVDFETNIMLFNGANITKNINELSIMAESLSSDVQLLINFTSTINCPIEQYCIENDLEYEFNAFSVQQGIIEKMNKSLDSTNKQIMDCISSVVASEPAVNDFPTSIRRRTRQAKLKKSK